MTTNKCPRWGPHSHIGPRGHSQLETLWGMEFRPHSGKAGAVSWTGILGASAWPVQGLEGNLLPKVLRLFLSQLSASSPISGTLTAETPGQRHLWSLVPCLRTLMSCTLDGHTFCGFFKGD